MVTKIQVSDDKRIYNAVRPAFILLHMFGLAPFSFTSGRIYSIITTTWSSILVSCFLWSTYSNIYYKTSFFGYVNTSRLIEVGDVMESMMCFVAVIVIFICSLSGKKWYQKIALLDSIDKLLFTVGAFFDYCKMKRTIKYLVAGFTLFNVLNITVQYAVLSLIGLRVPKLVMFRYHYGIDVTSLSAISYVLSVMIARHRFAKVNEILRDAAAIENDTRGPTRRAEAWKIIEKRLLVLPEVYSRLCDLVEIIDSLNGLQILTVIAVNFIRVVFLAFYVMEGFAGSGDEYKTTKCIFYSLACYGCLVNLLLIFGVVHVCSKNVSEALKAVTPLHEIAAKAPDHVAKQALQFSLYIVHRRPKHSACGLFPLDHSLIFTVCGAVTTYIVILIQFAGIPFTSVPQTTTLSLSTLNITY